MRGGITGKVMADSSNPAKRSGTGSASASAGRDAGLSLISSMPDAPASPIPDRLGKGMGKAADAVLSGTANDSPLNRGGLGSALGWL